MAPQNQQVTPAFVSTEAREAHTKAVVQAGLMSRNDQLRLGFLKPEDLDDEEIAHGTAREPDEDPDIPLSKHIARRQRRTGKNRKRTALGTHSYYMAPDQAMPLDVFTAMQQEHQRRLDNYLRSNINEALTTIVEVMQDQTAEPRDRMDAAKYIFERVAGKTPDKVEVKVDKAPWEEVLTGIANVSRSISQKLNNATNQDPNDPDNIMDVESIPEEDLPQPRMYGYIQTTTDFDPTNPYQPQPQTEDNQTANFDINQPQEAGAMPIYQPAGQELAVPDHDEQATVPSSQFAPPHPRANSFAAPDFSNPRNTSSTMPNTYDHPLYQAQEVYAAPSEPLSGYLREQQARAEELAVERKAQKAKQKDTQDNRKAASKARLQAKQRRIVRRTMGMDAMDNSEIQMTETPLGDTDSEEYQIKFSAD